MLCVPLCDIDSNVLFSVFCGLIRLMVFCYLAALLFLSYASSLSLSLSLVTPFSFFGGWGGGSVYNLFPNENVCLSILIYLKNWVFILKHPFLFSSASHFLAAWASIRSALYV